MPYLKLPADLFSMYKIELEHDLQKMVDKLPMRMAHHGQFTVLTECIAQSVTGYRTPKEKVEGVRKVL